MVSPVTSFAGASSSAPIASTPQGKAPLPREQVSPAALPSKLGGLGNVGHAVTERSQRLASVAVLNELRAAMPPNAPEGLAERAMSILNRQRLESEQGRGVRVNSADQPLPMLNLHVHFGGSTVAKLAVELDLKLPEGFDFEAEVQKLEETNFYRAPEGKGLSPYLAQYTIVSREIPIPIPVFAQMMAHELAYNCAQNGNITTEYRVNSLRDLFSIDKIEPEEYSDYAEKYVKAINAGLSSGSAAAKKDGLRPTIFGLIFDGNRFDPRALYSKDASLSPEVKLENSRKSALRLVKVQFEQAVRQVMIRDENPYSVAGVGLCGLEKGHSVEYFKEAIDIIHKHNAEMFESGRSSKILGMSIHAGEVGPEPDATAEELEKVRKEATAEVVRAIVLCWRPHTPVRIGHGVMADLKAVRREVEALGIPFDYIHFEMCPTSNIQIINGISGQTHPILPFLREGGSVAAYSDNDAMSGRVEKEPGVVGAIEQEVLQMAMWGIPSSFRLRQLGIVDPEMIRVRKQYAERGIHLALPPSISVQ